MMPQGDAAIRQKSEHESAVGSLAATRPSSFRGTATTPRWSCVTSTEYADPVDHFADVNRKLKVLVNLYHFPPVTAGAIKAGSEPLRVRIVHPHTIADEVFHPDNLITNRHALRNAFAILDVISLRCQYLLAEDLNRRTVLFDALRLADKAITISDFTKDDTLASRSTGGSGPRRCRGVDRRALEHANYS